MYINGTRTAMLFDVVLFVEHVALQLNVILLCCISFNDSNRFVCLEICIGEVEVMQQIMYKFFF